MTTKEILTGLASFPEESRTAATVGMAASKVANLARAMPRAGKIGPTVIGLRVANDSRDTIIGAIAAVDGTVTTTVIAIG